MGQPDDELLERVRERDSGAFELLFERYREMIQRHLARLVRDQSAADDLAQEVFLRVWLRAEQWDGRGAVRAWLFRIATNLGLNHLRSVGRRRERPLELSPDRFDAESESAVPGWMIDAASLGPDAQLAFADQRRRLRGLVEELPEEKREVFRMVVEAEMQTREVAEALGMPEGTVRSRLHHARKRLARDWLDFDSGWEIR
jgi:RNA polymerase sigma-70 factor (ECF subfamily)